MEDLQQPTCPEHLDRHGKKLWRRCLLNLNSFGNLHNADFDLIEQYCFLISECRRLSERLSVEGSTIEIPYKNGTMTIESPVLKAYLGALAKAKSLADSFGFTPKSRKELGSTPQKQEEDKFNNL